MRTIFDPEREIGGKRARVYSGNSGPCYATRKYALVLLLFVVLNSMSEGRVLYCFENIKVPVVFGIPEQYLTRPVGVGGARWNVIPTALLLVSVLSSHKLA